MYRLLTTRLQKLAYFLNRQKRKSIRQRRQLQTILKKLRHREQGLRRQMQGAQTSPAQRRGLLTAADVTNRQRRKGLILLKNLIQEIRS